MILGQSIATKEKEFVRTRASGMINTSTSSSVMSDRERRSEVKGEIEALRRELKELKKESGASELVQTLNDKIVYV